MNKLFLLAFVLFSSSVLAKDLAVLESENPYDYRKFNPRKSHWLTTFGFEGQKYDAEFDSFRGKKRNFAASKNDLWGGRLGIGGAVYLGGGMVTTTLVEGYYVGTLFSQVLNGGPEDEDEEFAYTKKTSQVWGAEASQSLGYMFNMKTKNPFLGEWTYLVVEPYMMAGIGIARAYNSINYSYNLTLNNVGVNERFKQSVEDELTTMKIGLGVNFTASSGFFFYTRLTQNRYDVGNREINTKLKQNTDPTISSTFRKDNSAKIESTVVYALGGGYRF